MRGIQGKELPIDISPSAPEFWATEIKNIMPILLAVEANKERIAEAVKEVFPVQISSHGFRVTGKRVSGNMEEFVLERKLRELLPQGTTVKLISHLMEKGLTFQDEFGNILEYPKEVFVVSDRSVVDVAVKSIGEIDWWNNNQIPFEAEVQERRKIYDEKIQFHVGDKFYHQQLVQEKTASMINSVLRFDGLPAKEESEKKQFPLPMQAFLSGDFEKGGEYTGLKEGLTPSQNRAYQRGIDMDVPLSFLHGGPGAGKTTVEMEIAKEHVKQGRSVLVLSHSNKGSQVPMVKFLDSEGKHEAAKKMFVAGNNPEKIDSKLHRYRIERGAPNYPTKKLREIRNMNDVDFLEYMHNKGEYLNQSLSPREIGEARKIELKKIEEEYEKKREKHIKLQKERMQSPRIVSSTFGNLLTDPNLFSQRFDVVMIDEATRMRLAELFQALGKADQKIIFVGDPFQLGTLPLAHEEREHLQEILLSGRRIEDISAALDSYDRGPFVTILQKANNPEEDLPYDYLEENFRSKPAIVNVMSNLIYNGKMKPARKELEEGDEGIIQWLDTKNIEAKERTFGTSKKNSQEAKFIAYKVIGQMVRKENPVDPEDIAVIATYKKQADAIRNILRNNLGRELYDRIKDNVATVDSFQGDERKIVYISLTRSNDEGDIGFLEEERRLGVAIGRAQDECYVVGNSRTVTQNNSTLESKDFFGTMYDLISKNGKISVLPQGTIKKINQRLNKKNRKK